jgi:hypothetical protein
MRLQLTSAVLQLGASPPFTCIDIPTRRHPNDHSLFQVKFEGKWHTFEHDRKPGTYWWMPSKIAGVPLAGIATTWESDR